VSLSSFFASAKGMIATVEADAQKYGPALKSALSAVGAVHDVIAKLESADPAQVAAAKTVVDRWAAVNETLEAAEALDAENEKDAASLSLEELEEGIAAFLKIAIAVAKFVP
jgi:hypothetical protein